jgi:hypothetical protein
MRESMTADLRPRPRGTILRRLVDFLRQLTHRRTEEIIEPPTDPKRARANAERYRRISGEQKVRGSGPS